MSAEAVAEHLPGAHVLPPVRHGDLLQLAPRTGDTVLILDGVFHQSPPIRHKEILEVIASGVRVIGAASMGALRAAELHSLGMIGYGWIFALYRDGTVDADDEVAVMHAEGPEWRQLSEPLVNVRWVLSEVVRVGLITPAEESALLAVARALPYQSRSWTAIQYAIGDGDLAGALRASLTHLRQHPGQGNRKLLDAIGALRAIAADDLPTPPAAALDWARTDTWRTTYLCQWKAEFTGRVVDGAHVADQAVFDYQRLYDPDFPHRWRRYVLARIAASADPPTSGTDMADTDKQAIAAAAAAGITLADLTPEQLAYWLTPAEQAQDGPETLLRLLVRSYHSYPGEGAILGGVEDPAGLIVDADTTRRRIVAAQRTNSAVSVLGPRRHIDDLKAERIRTHLLRRWAVDDSDLAAVTAAARDRGFPSMAAALEAARPFFLHAVTGGNMTTGNATYGNAPSGTVETVEAT
jgi:hypothetical protein